MVRQHQAASGPLSRWFDVSSVTEGGTTFRVVASAAERQAVAIDCGLPGIDALAAAFLVAREVPDGARVTGSVTARIRQICVLSLDEFESDLDEPVDLRFASEAEIEAQIAARAARPIPDESDDGDLPDPIRRGRIDLGALMAEILVLGLDPYPRKPGVTFAEPAASVPDEPKASPFAMLRNLKSAGDA
jgi:uncharacterized metal-binding protein YceD (DUF177 family)